MKWKPLEAPGELPEDFKRKTRFLIDEGLGPFVAEFLRRKGWNALFCGDFGLLGHSDEDVFACAWRERRILLNPDARPRLP
jgi:predicted nuclease of predicted toxin-antitoxin system